MQLSDALSQVSLNSRTEFQNLTEILSPEIIQKGLESSGHNPASVSYRWNPWFGPSLGWPYFVNFQ